MSPLTAEADAGVGAIAERFVAAGPAAAQPRRLDPRNDSPGAADDYHIAAHLQRPIE